ncbi:MmyB family transcriptional regulator [Streptomyces roseus]|uniref:MmyB family transcriptional regulator n=1 Tax=Streptomyces roseus TaxID=66430 RepID=UPI00069E4D7F|nr:helix-turn-helix domain-containing protein [Streptomyces roseus]
MTHRSRLTEETAALVRELLEDLRKGQSLSQEALGERLGINQRSYRNWLRRASALKAAEVARLVKALNMSPANRDTLYRLTNQLPPGPDPNEARLASERFQYRDMICHYQEMIDKLDHPSVVYTYCWDVVATNRAYRDVFGGVRPHATAHPSRNTQWFIYFHPDAPTLLGGGDQRAYREHWLLPSLAHFLATLQQRPDDPSLLALQREIERRPNLRAAYRLAPRWIARNGDIAINYSPRPLWDPRVGSVLNAHILTEAHQGYRALHRATFILRSPQRETAATAHQQGALFDLHSAEYAR